MRALFLAFALIAAAAAQGLPQGKAIEGIKFDSKGLINALNPHIHVIMHGGCKGKPDHVYGESKGVYYGCVGEQEVCTESKFHNGKGVPRALITQYQQVKALQEAEKAEFDRRQQERQEQRVREGRSTGDPKFDAELARQRSAAIANEVKTARAQGRQPDLAQFSKAGTATAAPATTQVATVQKATARRTAPAPLADAKLEGIEKGAALPDVLARLGNPYLRITGETDNLTYRLESGRTAKLEFTRGALTKLDVQ